MSARNPSPKQNGSTLTDAATASYKPFSLQRSWGPITSKQMQGCFYRALRLLMRSVVVMHLHHAAASQAIAQLATVEVSTDQRVTVVGRAPSLKTVVEDVCWRAGVSVDFYDAQDRPFGGSFRDLSLETFLRRVLSRESYMIGATSAPEPAGARITWLRVLGDPAVAAKRRATGSGGGSSRGPLDVPPMLVQTAFSSGADHATQQAALDALTNRIAGDPRELQSFLATDSALIAQTLAQYSGAALAIEALAARYDEPHIRAKLTEILAALSKNGR